MLCSLQMFWIELKTPIQIQADASVKKPDFVLSRSSNMSPAVTSATMIDIITANAKNTHAFSLIAILAIFLKYTCVCLKKDALPMLHPTLKTINIIVCSFFAALMLRINFHHYILKFSNTKILHRRVCITKKRKMTAVIHTASCNH